MASDLLQSVLDTLEKSNGPVLTEQAFPAEPFEKIKATLDTLQSREYVKYEQISQDQLVLSDEGKELVQNGSHEARVFEAVRKAVEGIKIKDLPDVVGKTTAKIGQGNAIKAKWIKSDSGNLVATTETISDTTVEQLKVVEQTKTHPDAKVAKDLKKRSLVEPRKAITFKVEKGSKFSRTFVRQETDLTADMLSSGAWKTVELKPYNFKALGAPTPSGALHPLNKVRTEFRQIFFEMGFTEMATDNFVETGFWNFDALFVPQQHPARDAQDTFFIKDPVKGDKPRPTTAKDGEAQHTEEAYKKYWDDVHAVHQEGKFGSIGYRYPWSGDESLRLVLRTHTTATSAAMLHKLALDPKPARLFSIDRVFRNETVDATHLAEFHQVEGVIADYDLTLGGLIGFMEVFYSRMGIHRLRFKPAYNPYTEPSMEIFGYHEGLKKWVEIGNSGMFRPEMLLPMGLPANMRVYGWGLSLERPTMIKYGVNNIRELLGHKVDLNFIETNPAVRLEKE